MLFTIFICLEAMTLPQIAGIKLIHIYTNWTMLKNIDMLSKIKSWACYFLMFSNYKKSCPMKPVNLKNNI